MQPGAQWKCIYHIVYERVRVPCCPCWGGEYRATFVDVWKWIAAAAATAPQDRMACECNPKVLLVFGACIHNSHTLKARTTDTGIMIVLRTHSAAAQRRISTISATSAHRQCRHITGGGHWWLWLWTMEEWRTMDTRTRWQRVWIHDEEILFAMNVIISINISEFETTLCFSAVVGSCSLKEKEKYCPCHAGICGQGRYVYNGWQPDAKTTTFFFKWRNLQKIETIPLAGRTI